MAVCELDGLTKVGNPCSRRHELGLLLFYVPVTQKAEHSTDFPKNPQTHGQFGASKTMQTKTNYGLQYNRGDSSPPYNQLCTLFS